MRWSAPLAFSLALLAVAVIGGMVAWQSSAPTARPRHFAVFDARGMAGVSIAVPPAGSKHAEEAAQLLRETLAASAGMPVAAFPLVSAFDPAARGIQLEVRPRGGDTLVRPVGFDVTEHRVSIWAAHEEDLILAASWFLEKTVQARWFTPEKDGREVARLGRLRLPLGTHESAPSFISRALGITDLNGGRLWKAANRLLATISHGHTADQLVTKEDLVRDPELRPEFDGRQFDPRLQPKRMWQPNLSAPATVTHVTRALAEKFRATGDRSYPFGPNDTWRWDQSAATLAAVAPHQWFRHFPDYSNTLFGFLNEVASRLEAEFPDRFVSTYAYQWTENTPRFAVHPNVVPFLTADRSQWFDPAWREEDQELIRRWTRSGARIVGTYDYYYGSPYLIPRPTLWAVGESIPFLWQTGVRAFTAEMNPNWGLDGPKAWLATQLLWDATQDPTKLLDEYYTRYWKESAEPLRRFFAICDEQFRAQPRPAYWIKYFYDDHQRLLFPPQVRQELWRALDEAEALARTPIVRSRLAQVRAAFGVTEFFCRHDEARDALARQLHRPSPDSDELLRGMQAMTAARRELVAAHPRVQRDFPWAISSELFGEYLRNDPRPRALRLLAQRGVLASVPAELLESVFGSPAPDAAQLLAEGGQLLRDPEWLTVRQREAHPFTLIEWNDFQSPWVVRSEPYETRTLAISVQEDGAHSLRFDGARQEGFYHPIISTQAGEFFRARVRVRGRVSPGNQTFLLVNFSDDSGRPIGLGHTDRLPVGDWPEWTTLEMIVRVPAHATTVGFGLRVLCQVNDDYAEFAAPFLEQLGSVWPNGPAR